VISKSPVINPPSTRDGDGGFITGDFDITGDSEITGDFEKKSLVIFVTSSCWKIQ